MDRFLLLLLALNVSLITALPPPEPDSKATEEAEKNTAEPTTVDNPKHETVRTVAKLILETTIDDTAQGHKHSPEIPEENLTPKPHTLKPEAPTVTYTELPPAITTLPMPTEKPTPTDFKPLFLPTESPKDRKITGPTITIAEPAPVEVARPYTDYLPPRVEQIPSIVISVPIPNVDVPSPSVTIPKQPKEIIDIPHPNITLPESSIELINLTITVPSPIIEAPKPIVQNKESNVKVPQIIVQIPKPVVQHKPKYYKVPHTIRVYNPIFRTVPYIFKIPQLRIEEGKSGYTHPNETNVKVHHYDNIYGPK